jgi:LMBR1 domain-containing protein 1
VFVFTVVVIIVYFSTGRKIDIPYTAYTYDLSQLPAGGGAFPPPADANFTTEWADGVAGNVRVGLSFAIFCVAIISALGWLLLIIFGGAGLPGVPVDFVNAWRNRPQPIGTKVYSEEKAALARISGQLIDAGEALEVEQRKAGGKPGRALRARLNAFKLDAHAVAAKHKALEVAYRQGGISPFLAVGYVVAAVVTALLSLAWVVHIVAANLLGYCVAESGAPSFSVSLACPPDRFVPGVAPVLSAVFKALSDAFALLGLVAYGLFAFYLLLCVVKGCVRVGTRFLLFSVHPLEPGATLMNSFLFNALLLLLAATAVAQFAAQSFRTYAANTAADVMFTAFVMAIPGIKYIYVYAQYAMLGIALITMVIMLACRPAPRDTAYKPIASG